jgi:hypothetical protein
MRGCGRGKKLKKEGERAVGERGVSVASPLVTGGVYNRD